MQTALNPTAQASPNLLRASLSARDIPSLNGLRGAAALVVVVYHYFQLWHLREFPGYYAVTLFFELSGLLITWLLLTEQERFGAINRMQFYIRRALRLFPVFYIVWALWRIAGPFAGSWAFALYMGDYYTAITQRHSGLVSAWSLGVEEKFYLLWPQVVVRFNYTQLTKVLLGVLLFEPILTWTLVALGYGDYTHFAFETNLEPVVLGCLIAVMAKRGWTVPKWMLHPGVFWAAIVGGAALRMYPEFVVLALAEILVYVICKPPRILNNPISRFFGAISYSLYLCHGYTSEKLWPLLFSSWKTAPGWIAIPLNIALAVIMATVLHVAIERPFLKLKDRFHKRRRVGAADSNITTAPSLAQ